MKVTDQNMEPNGKKSRDSRDGRRIILFSVLIVILLIAILITTLPQFYIKQIDVEGCSAISSEELLKSSGLQTGEHLFRNIGGGFIQLFSLRYGNIESELRSDYPYINNIKIQIAFPSKVQITVDERQKIGYVQMPDGYAVIDKDGYVVELTEGAAPSGVPLMEGLPLRTATLGGIIDLTDDKGLNNCITILNAVLLSDENAGSASEFSLMKCVKSIRFVQSGTAFVTLILPTNQKELLVRIGSLKNITADMNWLHYATEQNKFDSVGDGVLDMSGEEYTFRPAS